ncbi:pyrroline-5-carboxylate reductase [Bacillus rubiinfantis]|uniref:pyrroline-5-carboxylate reductase n=1 Tax=Bacillus rubiinfantis TaxID=1499680 RepID=UPI001FEB5024|nr:pyrroline-5-carboxylate reductase [Bacillus rubiinfantis]
MNQINVLFIGAGRMAQALIAGIKQDEQFSLIVANKGNKERLAFVREMYGVHTTDHWQKAVSRVNIIVLALPPENHDVILAELKQLVSGQLIVTIAAGISPTYLESELPSGTAVAWVMPNTAAKLGQSITLYALGHYVNDKQHEWIRNLIRGIGDFEFVTEHQIHELTAITGSAPAFVYLMASVLEKLAEETGISAQQARKLVAQMIAGSTEMLKTNQDYFDLIDEVATPGGSTAAGVEVLLQSRFPELLREAISACRKKAQELISIETY